MSYHFGKPLKKGLAEESHHFNEDEAGSLASKATCHSAAKSGPISGSNNTEELSFQDSGGGERGNHQP